MINSTGENCIFKRRHKHRFKTLLMLTALSIVSVAQAEIYQWVDKQGNVHITDNSMNVPDTRKENVRVIKGSEDRTPVGDSKTQPNPDLQKNDLHESDSQKQSEESAIDKRALQSDLQ